MSSTDRPNGLPFLIDVATAAEHLGVTERFVRRLVDENRVKYHKIGKFVRFHPNDISDLIHESLIDRGDRRHNL